MARYYAPFNPRVAVILNGYDPEIMDEARAGAEWKPRQPGAPLVIRYLGVVAGDRIPFNLLDALRDGVGGDQGRGRRGAGHESRSGRRSRH